MDALRLPGQLQTVAGHTNMKKLSTILAVVLLAAITAQAGPEIIVKQRAKEVVNQNNVRQGVGAPGAPAPQNPQAQAVRPLPPDPVAKLKADIAVIVSKPSVSAELKKQFTTNLLAAARGSKKPTRAVVEKFGNSLCDALAGKAIETPVQTRLAQDINLALNSASLTPQRMTEVGDDLQAILQTAGVARGPAISITGEMKAISAELQGAK